MLIAIDGGDPRLVYQAVIEKDEDGAVASVEVYWRTRAREPMPGTWARRRRRWRSGST